MYGQVSMPARKNIIKNLLLGLNTIILFFVPWCRNLLFKNNWKVASIALTNVRLVAYAALKNNIIVLRPICYQIKSKKIGRMLEIVTKM